MDFLVIALLPLCLLAINRHLMNVDRDNKIAIEEAKVRAAMMLRDAQEELRRQQHERQLSELRAVGEANIKRAAENLKAKNTPVIEKTLPEVSVESFASTSPLKVAADKMSSVTRDALADAGVFMSEPEEHV